MVPISSPSGLLAEAADQPPGVVENFEACLLHRYCLVLFLHVRHHSREIENRNRPDYTLIHYLVQSIISLFLVGCLFLGNRSRLRFDLRF